MIGTLFGLLIAYQLKHILADYLFQTPWMLGKFKKYPDYIVPLLAHVGVHAVFTFLIAALIKVNFALPLALLDAALHFVIDRVKASPDMLGKYKALSANEYMELLKLKKEVSDKCCSNINMIDIYLDTNKAIDDKFWSNRVFWWLIGVDQMCHHLTHYLIIYLLVR